MDPLRVHSSTTQLIESGSRGRAKPWVLNYIKSNGNTHGGRVVGLEPPTTFTCIVGDGSCLFRALAHIITGSEEQHMDVRHGIVSYMRTIGNLLVGGHVR